MLSDDTCVRKHTSQQPRPEIAEAILGVDVKPRNEKRSYVLNIRAFYLLRTR
jgi:hypothetical protein